MPPRNERLERLPTRQSSVAIATTHDTHKNFHFFLCQKVVKQHEQSSPPDTGQATNHNTKDQIMPSIDCIRSNKTTAPRTSSIASPRAGSSTLNLCANGMNHLKDPGLLRQGYTVAHLCLLSIVTTNANVIVIYKDAWMSNP